MILTKSLYPSIRLLEDYVISRWSLLNSTKWGGGVKISGFAWQYMSFFLFWVHISLFPDIFGVPNLKQNLGKKTKFALCLRISLWFCQKTQNCTLFTHFSFYFVKKHGTALCLRISPEKTLCLRISPEKPRKQRKNFGEMRKQSANFREMRKQSAFWLISEILQRNA